MSPYLHCDRVKLNLGDIVEDEISQSIISSVETWRWDRIYLLLYTNDVVVGCVVKSSRVFRLTPTTVTLCPGEWVSFRFLWLCWSVTRLQTTHTDNEVLYHDACFLTRARVISQLVRVVSSSVKIQGSLSFMCVLLFYLGWISITGTFKAVKLALRSNMWAVSFWFVRGRMITLKVLNSIVLLGTSCMFVKEANMEEKLSDPPPSAVSSRVNSRAHRTKHVHMAPQKGIDWFSPTL